MEKRITFLLDDDLAKKIRNVQSKRQMHSDSTVGFSEIIRELLNVGLKS